jgi:RNA polymerase sigma-70 factor (ECF subfamily)
MSPTVSSPFAADTTLVAALQAGDEDAFCWLLDAYSGRLHRLARSFVPTQGAAEEVVQETWLAVIAGIGRFEGRSSVKTWIYRILMNQARRRGARDARAVPFSALAGDDRPVVEPEAFLPAGHEWAGHWASPPWHWEQLPPERLEAAETIDVVRRTIEELAPLAREVIVLRDVEGWPPGEVSGLLEITDGHQRVVLHRARARVRRAVEAHLAETEAS